MKPRPDALAKLLKHCDDMAMMVGVAGGSPGCEKRKTRRLVNALLRERANEAASQSAAEMSHAYEAGSREQVFFFDAPRDRVRAAVLRRPTVRARGRAGR